jgi:hypothetical protein
MVVLVLGFALGRMLVVGRRFRFIVVVVFGFSLTLVVVGRGLRLIVVVALGLGLMLVVVVFGRLIVDIVFGGRTDVVTVEEVATVVVAFRRTVLVERGLGAGFALVVLIVGLGEVLESPRTVMRCPAAISTLLVVLHSSSD